MYNAAYFHPRPPDMGHACISAGLAAEELVREVLPARIWLRSCEWDYLRDEAEGFRVWLEGWGKVVGAGVWRGRCMLGIRL